MKVRPFIFSVLLFLGAGTAWSTPPTLKSGCQWEAWSTQYHDPARTSTSLGCISGALTPVWTYTADTTDAQSYIVALAAEPDAVYANINWGHCSFISGGLPQGSGHVSGLQITFDGATGWMTCPGSNDYWYDEHPPSIAEASVSDGFPQSLILNSDVGNVTPTATGTGGFGTGGDVWGQTAADATQIYQINKYDVDGPAWFVRALNHQGSQVWINNNWGNGRTSIVAPSGMAIDGSRLFYAPNYGANPFTSGIYAFDTASGNPDWFKATTPVSDISVGGGRVYLVEQSAGPVYNLVARDETTGLVSWSQGIASPIGSAPMYTGNQVIVNNFGAGTLQAFDPTSGGLLWTSTLQPSLTIEDYYTGSYRVAEMVAMKGSQTLVVIGNDNLLHVLSLSSGQEVWKSTSPLTSFCGLPVAVGNRLYINNSCVLGLFSVPEAEQVMAFESLGDLASSGGGGGSSSSSGPAASIVENVRVYPNPWRGNQHGGKPITFDQMNGNSTVKIFTEDAHWVKTLQAPNGSVMWDLTNDSGKKVASGLYLYSAADGSGSATQGKFSIIK